MSKKDEIIDATSELFAEKGYELSMSDIAARVGIKTPSLYSHFESKDEIIGIVLEREMTNLYRFFERTIEQRKEGSTELKLKKLFQSYFEYFDTPGRLAIWRRVPFIDNEQIKAKCTEIILQMDETLSKKVKNLIKEGIESGEVRQSADEGTMMLYLVMIQGLLDTMLFQRYTSAQMESYTLSAWEAFWNGIKI
jgi:AcrR family transcriptional regulator